MRVSTLAIICRVRCWRRGCTRSLFLDMVLKLRYKQNAAVSKILEDTASYEVRGCATRASVCRCSPPRNVVDVRWYVTESHTSP
jgi:hypothetical protein